MNKTLVMNNSTDQHIVSPTRLNRSVLFLSVLLGMTILGWFYFQGGSGGMHAALINKKAPEFTVVDEKGKKVKLSDFKGRPVILHFWATWCPPCRAEFPHLNTLYQGMKTGDAVLLAVSLDEEGKKAVDVFRKKVSFDFPIYFNPSQDVADLYATFGLPETFFINRQGVVVKKYLGPQDWTSPAIKDQISKL